MPPAGEGGEVIKHMRCLHCGRRRKPSHEKRAQDTGCVKMLRHPENRNWIKLRVRQIHGGSIQPP